MTMFHPIKFCWNHPRATALAAAALVSGLGVWLHGILPPIAGWGLAMAEIGLGIGLARLLWPQTELVARLNQSEKTAQRIAAELAHYQTFTDILRRQGEMVTAITESAAITLIDGLRNVDAGIDRIVADCSGNLNQNAEEIEELSRLMILLMGSIQFQDITRQQIEQMARMSVMVDQHIALAHAALADLSRQFDTTSLADKLDQVFADYVMAAQRDSHRAARGESTDREGIGATVELF
ncbi:hypothetical protein [Magnetospirillum molischianum]|uniref:Methyl-accepting chemotaxis protein n=1 Tax=Magnetospirillum molischianum DSM 120 TaxID=1150626 RepID=H8FVG6_MAGML|nr:hypothetical protein [Magnetospirillum molischianum]CCG42354.1 exported hypothetical protein [Magnetospirillum molischianum DSM 120]